MLKAMLFTGMIALSAANVAGADAGNLFSITEECHVSESIPVMICLNGDGPLSCQTYVSHATHLRIKTTPLNHMYANAGIQVLSSLYTPTNCTPKDNGYCLFSVNDTTSTTIVLQSISGDFSIC